MTDTNVGYPTGVAGGVAAYVREVRAELADLPTEDIDDLTGGMEADLSELAADSGGDLIGRLGSPALYAGELRAAAGLPERVPGSVRRRPLTEAVYDARVSFKMLTDQRPWLRSVIAFLVTLRPAWWVLRGFLAAWVMGGVLGTNHGIRPQGLTGYVLAMVAIVVSVQLGRGWLRHMAVTRPLLALGNTTAVVVSLIASTSGVTSGEPNFSAATDSSLQGVSLNGQQVGNIYPYDSEGKRITGVRLFAQDGRPLDGDLSVLLDTNGNPIGLDASGNPTGIVRDSSGAQLRNVYPWALAGAGPWQVADPASTTYPEANPPPWTPPLSIVPLAPSSAATPTLAATPTGPGTAAPTTPQTGPTVEPVLPKPKPPTSPKSAKSPK